MQQEERWMDADAKLEAAQKRMMMIEGIPEAQWPKDGSLALIPTPIGNLGDMTLRALDLLQSADLIACEDTRHSRPMLERLGIDRPLISYHKFNEQSRADELLDQVEAGASVAVITDAGMPAVSDPGAVLVAKCAARGLPFTVLPGASAGVVAVVASGLGDGRYLFWGFLPRKGAERREALSVLDRMPVATVIYEAPHRIRRTMEELGARWPDRQFALIREWTKRHEERMLFLGKEAEGLSLTEKGEFVLVLGPAEAVSEGTQWTEEQVKARLLEEEQEGRSGSEAVRLVAEESGWRRNAVYMLREKFVKKENISPPDHDF